jgi:hypothetical protein
MGFQSQLLPGERVYDDSHGMEHFEPPAGQGRGLQLHRRTVGFGAGRNAPPFPSSLLIPRDEWKDRIAEAEATKSRLSDLVTQAGLPCKNQEQTNYCWVNAPTHCAEIARLLQNEPPVVLSPASVGAPVKDYANEGGWGQEALDYAAEHGWAPVALWPANAISSQFDTDASRAARASYRQELWYELRPRNLDDLISALLRRMAVAAGLNWWSHEVTFADPVWVNDDIAVRMRNSWGMNWPSAGAGGWSILSGSKMLPDDAVTPVVMLPSN